MQAATITDLHAWYPTDANGDPLNDEQLDLLADCCATYAINPDPRAGEIRAIRAGGSLEHFEPLYIVVVTGGGQKLRHPADQATIDTLRRIFACYRPKPDSRGHDQIVPTPLPHDLSLPLALRNGRVPKSEGH